jgi:hypothetical protein
MLIETTLHVNKGILEMINEYAEKTRRSRTFIIKILMQRVMNDNQRMLKSYSRIKYQERDEKENWYRVHLVLNEYEYEYYLDMRKFFKMSVSYILAYAVLRYLDELLDRNINTDNYSYKNYVFIMKTVDGTILWQIYWGIPPQLISC